MAAALWKCTMQETVMLNGVHVHVHVHTVHVYAYLYVHVCTCWFTCTCTCCSPKAVEVVVHFSLFYSL